VASIKIDCCARKRVYCSFSRQFRHNGKAEQKVFKQLYANFLFRPFFTPQIPSYERKTIVFFTNQAADSAIFHCTKTGATNLFAIAGHFVSYRCVSGPHNFLCIPWNLLKTKKIVHQRKQTTNESNKKFKTAGLAWILRGPHEILLRAACS